jgi:hypothetical protein
VTTDNELGNSIDRLIPITLIQTAMKIKHQRDLMLVALTEIARHLDADDEASYRADDPEGAMDTCHALATAALKGGAQ